MEWDKQVGIGHAKTAALESENRGFLLALAVCVRIEGDNVKVEIYRENGFPDFFYRDVLAQYILNAEFEDAN